MAKKVSVSYVCSQCGAVAQSWSGRCAQCGEWNTLQEEVSLKTTGIHLNKKPTSLKTDELSQVLITDQPRLAIGFKDIDNVLGGGLVPGSLTLLAGQPGVGKSTLLLQLAAGIAKSSPVLYISGEESAHQVALRAKRLGLTELSNLKITSSTSTDDIVGSINDSQFSLVIVDSIQTVALSDLTTAAGSVSQITASTQVIMAAAKASNVSVILVGHVTKEGMIAGPKILEHVVDVVLQLEGDALVGLKILRATKNRFGSTNETAIFEMKDTGLTVVSNPSASLLEERQITDGSVVLATLEGTRPLLVEVQALVNPTSYGYPKRAASGIDINRVNLLLAVLERRTKLKLSDQDIYINIVGGIKVTDPAADLAICMAIGSASKGLKLKAGAVVFGEVGLSGEVRRVPFIDRRVNEAKKLGFKLAIGPKPGKNHELSMLKTVTDVRSALNSFLEKS